MGSTCSRAGAVPTRPASPSFVLPAWPIRAFEFEALDLKLRTKMFSTFALYQDMWCGNRRLEMAWKHWVTPALVILSGQAACSAHDGCPISDSLLQPFCYRLPHLSPLTQHSEGACHVPQCMPAFSCKK